MQKFRKIWLGLFMLFLVGCSSLRPAGLPMSPGVIENQMSQVQAGDKIIINLTSGESLVGNVISVNSESVKIVGDKNYGRWEQEVFASDIETLELVYISEKDKQQNKGILVTVVVGLLGAIVYGFYYGLSQLD